MLQVDANIGGRNDQKNNGRRTKTLAVGLLMDVGCFVVGYFSATTTTTATTTAHTRVDMPTDASTLSSASSASVLREFACTEDGFCQQDCTITAFNCCSGLFTIDTSCLAETQDCAFRCGAAPSAAPSVAPPTAPSAVPLKPCMEDGFCQRDYGICSNRHYYPTFNCCSKKYTLDTSCDETGGCAVRCGGS